MPAAVVTVSVTMPKQVVTSDKGLKSPLFSQATIHNGTVFVSGNIGIVPSTMKVVEGSVADRTKQALENIRVVLEEAGSSFDKLLKMNIYLTNMEDYAAMNEACAWHP
jgi:2-iminobutanoate/2-iminopropanoate deaminase